MDKPSAFAQATIDGGQIVTVPGSQSSPWNIGGDLTVGSLGSGTLQILAGGAVSNATGYVGQSSGSMGVVRVDGAAAQWVNSGSLFAGLLGSGTLEILNGAAVSNASGIVGGDVTGVGAVIVNGAGSQWSNSGQLNVGFYGNGTLEISGQGTIFNTVGSVGEASGAVGRATVTGNGSQWINSGNVFVGNSGNGTLEILNGGSVSSASGYIANGTGAVGRVTVDGVGSLWNGTSFFVGYSADAALTVSGGGAVTGSGMDIGVITDSLGTVSVLGAGSRLLMSGGINIGRYGGEGSIAVSEGGYVSSNDGSIGRGVGSVGSVIVEGPGSEWRNSAGLVVGAAGTGTLEISGGGLVDVPQVAPVFVGMDAGASGMVTVSGAGSLLQVASGLTIGQGGTGMLTVAEAGAIASVDLTIAANAGSTGILNIGAAVGGGPAAAGTVNAASVFFGAGVGAINFNHTDTTYLFSAAISGAGSINAYHGATFLTAANTYTGPTTVYGGTLAVTGGGSIAGSSAVSIASDASFAIVRTTANGGNYSFANALTGSGTLSVSLLGSASSFDFAASAGTAFAGTVALGTGTFNLSGVNTAALAHATLELGTGNVTTVGAGTQTIGGLAFNGGTVIFDAQPPATNVANTLIATTGVLDVSGPGTIRVSLPTDFADDPPTVNTTLSLMEQDNQNPLVRLVQAGGAVTGTAGSLSLIDQNGNPITNDEIIGLTHLGDVVADAHYDYRLTTTPANDGLYINYGLTQIDLIGTGADALTLTPRTGATGAAADLSALITGTGDLAIAAGPGDHISLSNTLNDYTGATFVRSGTLLLANDNVLGQTSALDVAAGAVADMGGFSQSVGALNTAAGSQAILSGTLTVTDAQRTGGVTDGGSIEGNTLFGNGSFVIDPSVVHVNGAQVYAGLVTVTGGSQLIVNAADAFGSAQGIVLASAADTLTFGDESGFNPAWTAIASGTMATPLSGLGTVRVQDGSDIALAGDNGAFAGAFAIGAASVLRASQAANLGTASIADNGTFVATAATDWVLANAVTGSGLVVKNGSAILRADRSLAAFTGATQVDAGTLAFGDATTAGAIGGAVTVTAGAVLDGNGTIAGPLTNAGTVALSGAAAGNRLTVPDYAGQGGTLVLHTVLGDDASLSDRLVIDGGAATGSSFLSIVNAGGFGALTVADGIVVVDAQNGATTTVDAFTLAGRVAAGAYEYSLYRGGIGADAGNDSWYLRSVFTGEEPAPPEEQLPNYRAEVSVDMVVPALASRFGLDMLGTYHDRVGDADATRPQTIWCKDPSQNYRCAVSAGQSAAWLDAQAAADARRYAGWGRVFGETGNVGYRSGDMSRRFDNFLKHGPSYSYGLAGFQAGMDLLRREHGDGSSDIAGLYVGVGRVDSDVQAVFGGKAGSTSLDGYSVGGYWTHKGASGWYVDAVAQGTRYDNIEASSDAGQTLKTRGWGFAGSLEAGYPFQLGWGLVLEPQAQLIYQHISLDKGRDAYGLIAYGDSDAVYGRIGARLSKAFTLENGRTITAYARANVWQGFGDDAKTTFASLSGANPVTLKTDLGGAWGQIGLGVSGQLTQSVSAYASGDYNFALGDDRRGHSWSGRAGLKVTW